MIMMSYLGMLIQISFCINKVEKILQYLIIMRSLLIFRYFLAYILKILCIN